MPRGDCVICFSGDTMYAYPVILQAIAAVSQDQILLNRAMDIEELKGHLLRVLNNMLENVHTKPIGAEDDPDTKFIFGGWSWKRSAFKVWLLHFDASIKRFTFRPAQRWRGANKEKMIAFTGDYETEFRERLVALLRKKRKIETGSFDMEPFEIIRDMLRENTYEKIGGPPQVVKVYRYSNVRPLAVIWPDQASGSVQLLGRPLLNYEQLDYSVLDPDTLKTASTNNG